MADQPPIRRPLAGPPPIPPGPPVSVVSTGSPGSPGAASLAPIAPAAATTDLVPLVELADVADDHRSLDAPDPGPLVGPLLALIASETAALLAAPTSTPPDPAASDALADLHVRAALATWDALDQPTDARRLLELADGHPLAARLRLAALLATAAPAAELAAADPAIATELAEALLWRHRDAARAAAAADRSPDARALAALAHAATGGWPRVIELHRAALPDERDPEAIAACAALLLDRVSDPAAALELCWEALAHFPGPDARALGWLRTFDVALAAAAALGDERRLELLDNRAELVAALAGGALEALATRHALASGLELTGHAEEAAGLWLRLADEPGAQTAGAARRASLVRAAWAAAAARPADTATALAAHRRLADCECSEAAASHAWRALELAAATGDPGTAELARVVVDATGSAIAERTLDEFDVAALVRAPTTDAPPALIARFVARGGAAVRWAAALTEPTDPAAARALWQTAGAHDHALRLLRAGGDLAALSAAYALAAEAETDPRSAAALWTARGVVDLARGDSLDAEDALRRAAELAPRDPFCRAALAAVYRAGQRHAPLARVLDQLATLLTSRDARAALAREHAQLLDEHLGDRAGARAALERMIDERPDDPDALLALAALCDRDSLADRAIELRRRAAALAPPGRRGEIWLAIAAAEERRGQGDAALAAFTAAAEAGHTSAAGAQVRLHRQAGRLGEALALVRGELAGDPPLARRMQLQRELAEILTELGREPAAVVAAYLDVLSIEPDQTDALAGIEAPARALALWDELARAFRGAPQTPRNLEVLAEALAHIAEWSELVEVRRRQLEAATDPAAKAQRAGELAALYEHELGDSDAAIRMLGAAQAAHPDDARQRDLLRLLRDAARWPELAAALERELPGLRATDTTRQVAILRELGELRGGPLARPGDAAQAYERVLEVLPGDPAATAALEALYGQLGRDRELARLVEARAEAETDPARRATLFEKVGELRANRSDIDGALAAYAAAFKADPANRGVFTAMERVCYKAERWAAAMELYSDAIEHVEAGQSRAYRLGDLYARRANVQLNFLGQDDAGATSLAKVIEVDSQPQQAAALLEELCLRLGDWQPLIAAWERRAEVQRDPQRKADALRAAADISAQRSVDPRQSVRINRKLLQLDPSDSGAAAKLESFYEDAEDQTGLIDVLALRLQQAASVDEQVDLLKRIARAAEDNARDVVMATEHYHKVLALQDGDRDALEALGRIFESTEQWAEFIDITRKQIRVTTDRNTKALLYFRCGSVMEAKFGRETDAIKYYDAAIRTSPSCLPAVHGLRDLYRRREEWPRVIETLELEVKLWQDDKERAGVFAQIGRIYDQLGDGERAMQYYDSALGVDPECLPANQAMFEHLFERGAWDKAQPIAAALAQKAMREGDPGTRSEFYRKRGVVAQMTGDWRGAADCFIVALEIKPHSAEALDALAALARERPDAWDFEATYRELDKLYRRRDDAGPLLARVHVARAVILEREGDLDQAVELYRQATELAPGDGSVLAAVVAYHADLRHWSQALAAIELFVGSPAASEADRIAALMRQAAIHADGELDPARAIGVLRDVLAREPAHHDAYYLLAQQHYLRAEYGEARAAIDRVIELATAPGEALAPSTLARYYYYKGRILDAAGDPRAAAPQYRRAIDYDPGYAPPALVLARRAAEAGDQRQAETLLIEAAHAAMAQGGPRAAVPLQRGLARILLASGDRPAAIEAYRGILNVEPDGASDRVALAEIYAIDDPQRATGELRKVLERDIHHAPAYRLLATYFDQLGDADRAIRVLTALDLLGFAEDADHAALRQLRAERASEPLRRPLDDLQRARLLYTAAAREPLGEVFAAFAEQLSAVVPQPSLGANLQPAHPTREARLIQLAEEVSALYQVEAELFIGEKVPGLAAVTAYPRRLLVIDRALVDETDASLRFLFGYALEAIRGGYATLLQLGARHRRELVQLLRALVAPDGELTGPAAELVSGAPVEAQRVLGRHAGLRDVDPGAWIDGMLALAKRAGLVACDDFAAAIWTVARMSGEHLTDHDDTVALGSVLGGPDLVRFYLSDDYQALRDLLTAG